MSHTTVCPKCHQKSRVDESLIGRFVTCEHCQCLYYVVVPPLGEERTEWQALPATSVPHPVPGTAATRPAVPDRDVQRDPVRRLMGLLVVNLILGALTLLLQIVALMR